MPAVASIEGGDELVRITIAEFRIEIFDDLLWPRHRISHERAVKWGGLEGNVEGQSLLRVVVRASAGRAGRLWQGHRVESVAMVQCKDAARDPRLFPT
jgi:hypothetical protein